MVIFHSYVSLPEGRGKIGKSMGTLLEMDVERMFEWEIQELNGWIFQLARVESFRWENIHFIHF